MSVHVEGVIHDTVRSYGFAVARPDKLSLGLKKGVGGATVVCDGTKLYTYVPAAKAYTAEEAPGDVSVLAQQPTLSMLFVGCLVAENPYDAIMEGVASVRALGSEQIDGTTCLHLKFSQKDFDRDLWVEDGAKPLVHRESLDMSPAVPQQAAGGAAGKDVKATMTVTFRNWQTEGAPPPAAFLFVPAQGAKEVKSFEEAAPRTPQASTYVAKPIPTGPDAYTWRQHADDRQKWFLRTSVDAYKEMGIRDPAWDDAVMNLFQVFAEQFSRRPGSPGAAELLEAAEPVIKTGCTDPLVLCLVGTALHANSRQNEAETYLRRAVEGFKTVKYAKGQARLAAVGLAQILQVGTRQRKEEAERWMTLLYDWTGESAGDGSFAPGEERMFWDVVEPELPLWHERRAKQLYEAVVGRAGADPWMEHVVAGWCETKLAWQERGGGWASSVTEEGWRGFALHLEKARQHLTAAYALHPQYPEAAALMIPVVMGSGGEEGETERTWFDRAVAAQLDYGPAYGALLWAWRPRWGGSLEQMHSFALECLDTGRFDTRVPEYYFDTVLNIVTEEEVSDFWQAPGVYANLCRLCVGIMAEPSRAAEAHAWASRRAAAAWRCGKFEDARRWFAELGDDVQADCFPVFGTSLQAAKRQSYAYGGELAAEIKGAEARYRGAEPSSALPLFEELVTKAGDPFTAAYVRGFAIPLRIEQGLEGDAWIGFLPEKDLAGWRIVYGSWEVEPDGALRIVPDREVSLLLCNARIRHNYELRGSVEFAPSTRSVQGGLILGYTEEGKSPFWVALRFYMPGNQASLGVRFTARKEIAKGHLADVNRFHVQVWEGRVTATINDEPAFVGYKTEENGYPDLLGLAGFGGYATAGKDPWVRYRNVEVRRLTIPPPTPPAP
jgi:hypothetical protein